MRPSLLQSNNYLSVFPMMKRIIVQKRHSRGLEGQCISEVTAIFGTKNGRPIAFLSFAGRPFPPRGLWRRSAGLLAQVCGALAPVCGVLLFIFPSAGVYPDPKVRPPVHLSAPMGSKMPVFEPTLPFEWTGVPVGGGTVARVCIVLGAGLRGFGAGLRGSVVHLPLCWRLPRPYSAPTGPSVGTHGIKNDRI